LLLEIDTGDAVLDKGGLGKDVKDDDLLLIGDIGVIVCNLGGEGLAVLNIPFVGGTKRTLELVI
jgi:hypothetical protein